MSGRVVSEDADVVLGDSDSDDECISLASDSDDEIPVEPANAVNNGVDDKLGDQKPKARVVSDLAADSALIKRTLGVDADHDSVKESYGFQSFHELAALDQYPVPIWISEHVNDGWKRVITSHAIVELNTAAPGINLHIVKDKNKARILIFNAKEDSRSSKTAEQQGRRAYTKEKILSSRRSSQLPVARIYLGNDFSNKRHRRTTVHEILHALGFKHEHKQKGADQELAIVNPKKLDDRQLIPEDNIHGLTRFDPFSIMMYNEGGRDLKRTAHADPVWQRKKSRDLNQEMSELDKVGLNLFYPPREHSGYKPKWNPATNMYYCSRKVMAIHNRPDGPISDGFCGGDPSKAVKEGPNCPACRTLKSPDGATLPLDKSRWQGWSGMIYCGKNGCGPDFGQPCQECRKLLYPGQ